MLGSFEQRDTTDKFDRKIHYYLQGSGGPTVVWIPGSGCSSLFRRDNNGAIRGGYQNLLQSIVRNQGIVLTIEKPGVELYDSPARPGSAQDCSKDFLEEHTLERWGEAIRSAIEAAARLHLIDLSKGLMLVGHSEGGIVSAYLSNILPETTHIAFLAGGGPTQLYDFLIFSQRKNGRNTAREEDEIWSAWDSISKDPTSISRSAWGHPFKRWASFMSTSPIEELKKSKAKILAVHGTQDQSSPIESFDILRSELTTAGAKVTFVTLEGADHGFNLFGEQAPKGMQRVFQRAWDWFRANQYDPL
ncbi:prolyl oligopeptidase family serine peptidase [bacterium]|nr:prolyl oligopeptidase family serine peptidase [bacterium]